MTTFQIVAYWVLALPGITIFSAKTAADEVGFALVLLWCLAVAALIYTLLI